MRWTLQHNGAPRRVNHAAVAIGHEIYTFGGFCGGRLPSYDESIDVFVFNTETLEWKNIAYSNKMNAPCCVYGHSVVAYRHFIYLWGGQNTEFQASNKLFCFDTETLKWSSSSTTDVPPTDGHSACIIGNDMYIFGGFDSRFNNLTQTVYRVNLVTHVWEKIHAKGQPPSQRDFHTASAVGNRMYIFGGRSCGSFAELYINEDYPDDIMYLDTSSMTWVTPNSPDFKPCGRRSHSACVYNNEIYIIGGLEGHDRKHLNDITKYNPITNKWTKLEALGRGPCSRRRHCTVVVEDNLYLFGGSSPSQSETRSEADHLQEHHDLHILDFFSSLTRLCQLKIIESKLNIWQLPNSLQKEINSIIEFSKKREAKETEEKRN